MFKKALFLLILISFSCSDDYLEPSTPDPDPVVDVVDPTSDDITKCENGMAGDFPCNGYDLLARIPLNTISVITIKVSFIKFRCHGNLLYLIPPL